VSTQDLSRAPESPRPGVASRAAIVAIGSEMLGPLRLDTNSQWLSARLEEVAIPVVRKAVVGDDPEAIGRELSNAAAEATHIFTTGGLGPTADDVTVSAMAAWLETPLRRDADFLARMRARFERRGLRMPAVNEKQADFLVGARVLENPRGTAPGFWAAKGDVEIVILPGVPSEMREIMEGSVLPALRERAGGTAARRRVLRIAGMGESFVEEIVAPVYRKWSAYPVTILASPGEVQLHLCVQAAADKAESILDEMEGDFRSALGERIFGRDDEDLSATVGRLLRESHRSLAVAESCTGGMISALLTDIPGSSEYFLGGVVSYANSAKEEILGVSRDTVSAHGAVSEQAAREMAEGASRRFGADLAVSVTGIAGPDGGTVDKPVGTVWFALAERGGAVAAKKRRFVGDRPMVRRAASLYALEFVRRHLIGQSHD
jgi:competence/damage-inducible protein CinA-like protein